MCAVQRAAPGLTVFLMGFEHFSVWLTPLCSACCGFIRHWKFVEGAGGCGSFLVLGANGCSIFVAVPAEHAQAL
jgi:hypothetical protein